MYIEGFTTTRNWCTYLQGNVGEYLCKDVCKDFGEILCAGNLAHVSYQEHKPIEKENSRKCCCAPKCDPTMKLTCTVDMKKNVVDQTKGTKCFKEYFV